MADLEVQIGARSYRVACEDGQEAHLEAVAARLRQEADALTAQFGALSETRLLLMSGLLVADRLRAAEAQGGDARRLSARLGEAEAKAEALLAEKGALTQDLAAMTLEAERMRAQARAAAAERNQAREALAAGGGSADGAGAATGAEAAASSAAAARIAALEAEIDRLRAEGTAGAEAELAALRDRVAAAEHRNALLSEQIETAEERAAALAAQLEAAKDGAREGSGDGDGAEAAKALDEATRRIRVLIGDIEEGAIG